MDDNEETISAGREQQEQRLSREENSSDSGASLLTKGKTWLNGLWKRRGNEALAGSEEGLEPVSYLSLFRFATKEEKMMIGIATLGAIVHGTLFPIIILVWGDAVNAFEDVDLSDLVRDVGVRSAIVMGLGGVAFVTSAVQVGFQTRAAQRQGVRIRKRYMNSLMRQDFAWYDRAENTTGGLTARAAADVDLIISGIGDKLTSVIQYGSMFFTAVIVAFIYSWRITLVLLSMTPILLVSGTVLSKVTAEETSGSQKAYSTAGGVAQEALSMIRIVTAYRGQEIEHARYKKALDEAYRNQMRQGHAAGVGLGFSNFAMFSIYGIAFWYGGVLVRRNQITLGDLFTAFFSMSEAAFGLGLAAPHFKSFGAARGAAPRTWQIIDRKSDIDPMDDSGEILTEVQGRITFEKASFAYESRPNHLVLDKVDMEFLPGKSTALVGPSGCGKSSVLRLIERFYDLSDGCLKLDGVDVRELNVGWLRSQIGFVSQMPTLFAGTIRENIAYGARLDFHNDGGKTAENFYGRKVSDEDIIRAAKVANAHQFISKLPDGYETMLGERGAKLSGGQKQRIAIARAVVRDPQILCLDEATSALDAKSERIVQEALERAQHGRTVIVVAHRLSTVHNCDSISVLEDGKIVESGSHDELVQRQHGHYKKLIELQDIHRKRAEEGEEVIREVLQEGIGDAEPEAPPAKPPTADISKSIETPESTILGEAKKETTENISKVDKRVLRRAFKMSRPELPYILGGAVGAGVGGSAWVVLALVFSEASNEILMANRASEVRFWSLMFLAIAGGSFIGTYVQYTLLTISGERLSKRLRLKSFRAMMRQEMGFFDRRENAVGALSTRLATEASNLKEVVGGDSLGALSFAVFTLVVGFIISFTGCWEVALLVLGFMPIIGLAGLSQMKVVTGFDLKTKKKFSSSGAVAAEALDNVRTVTTLGIQDIVLEKYSDTLKGPLAYGRRASMVAGFSFGIAEALVPVAWASAFWFGAAMVRDGRCDFLGLMKSITGIVFGAMMVGNVSLRFPDLAAARVAATKIFRLLDRKSEIDPSSANGTKVEACGGEVELIKVYFEYPTRPSVPVLRGLSVKVEPGITVALVGPSGCGKSSIINLIERFYDPREGSITLDGHELRSLDVQSCREQMGIVSQEPDLFMCSVKENILYGLTKEEFSVITDEQVIAAAKAANAHEFISKLQDGYDTKLGERGEQLSGGQRQRIAIARCLIRDPQILLLDEATSALDAESEKIVQKALDNARSGRTCVLVAHRLSTVIDADIIAVIKKGKIAEAGTHAELLHKNGVYAALVKYQMSAPPDKLLPKDI